MRKKIAAGNWKMNKNLREGEALASEVSQIASTEISSDVELVLFPPFIHLTTLSGSIEFDSNISIGAQNCSSHDAGAYTGEVSAEMLKSTGVKYILVGHSERREQFGESDELLAEKTTKVLSEELCPVFCCGEPLAVRESGNHIAHVSDQIEKGLFHLSAKEIQKVVIAYEPIWAIGTGVTASTEQAQEMHRSIRLILADQYGIDVADTISILYGGSVKPDNATELFSQPDVDGGLIGGASLNARDFTEIAKSF